MEFPSESCTRIQVVTVRRSRTRMAPRNSNAYLGAARRSRAEVSLGTTGTGQVSGARISWGARSGRGIRQCGNRYLPARAGLLLLRVRQERGRAMDWREPADAFGRQLAVARETVLANAADPWRAVEPFETLLEELRYGASDPEGRLARLRSLGRQLFAELRAAGRPVAMEVRHYCWHLQHLGEARSPASSVKDILMVTLTRFAHYEGHEVGRCSICAEFQGDLPFRGSPNGRAHFHEWLKRRTGADVE